MSENCKTCGWARQIPNVKTMMKCGCPLSGCFNTDVLQSESCERWKKASDKHKTNVEEEYSKYKRDGRFW